MRLARKTIEESPLIKFVIGCASRSFRDSVMIPNAIVAMINVAPTKIHAKGGLIKTNIKIPHKTPSIADALL